MVHSSVWPFGMTCVSKLWSPACNRNQLSRVSGRDRSYGAAISKIGSPRFNFRGDNGVAGSIH